MADSSGSPLVGMGFSVANKMVDSVFNEHAANKAFSRQKALMQMQNELAIQNWERENAYNTPAAVKQRLMAAGINPDLMYGQLGMASMQSDISSPSAPSAPMSSTGISNLAQDIAAIQNAITNRNISEAQIPNINADTGNKVADTRNKEVDTEGKSLDNVGKELANEYSRRTLEDRVANVGLQNHWTQEQINNMKQQTVNLQAQYRMLIENINNAIRDGKLKDKEIKYFDAQMSAYIQNLRASSAYQNAAAGFTDSQKALLDQSMPYKISMLKDEAQHISDMTQVYQKYGEAQAVVGMVTDCVGAASDLIGSLTGVGKLIKGAKSVYNYTTNIFNKK